MIFQHKTVSIKSFSKFCRRNFVVCFLGVLRLKKLLIAGAVEINSVFYDENKKTCKTKPAKPIKKSPYLFTIVEYIIRFVETCSISVVIWFPSVHHSVHRRFVTDEYNRRLKLGESWVNMSCRCLKLKKSICLFELMLYVQFVLENCHGTSDWRSGRSSVIYGHGVTIVYFL